MDLKVVRVVYEIHPFQVVWYLAMREIGVFRGGRHQMSFTEDFDEYLEPSVENALEILRTYLQTKNMN
jgi:hypothetical protein